jgi:Uncharacterized protein conserved in bacteria (DUF2188)
VAALAQGFTCPIEYMRQVIRRAVMAKRSPVHVEPREKGWAVVQEGNERATSVHSTQAEAAREGRDIACRDETDFSSAPRTEGSGSTTATGKREQPRKEEK